jgi:molybdopterin/thiamine biosynthesis adenylyltransferase
LTLTNEQKERYSRTLVLKDFGEQEMEKVVRATVSVVGAGGLGSPALRLLTAFGFGKIRIIDRDIVELSNLQRQTVYNTSDIGKPKAEAAAANLALLNPDVRFEPMSISIEMNNAVDLLKGSEVIIDGLDTIHSRQAINSASVALKIPYVFAGAIEYYANLTTFLPGQTGCLHCMMGDAQDNPQNTCAIAGVSPTVLSIAAAIEVQEALLVVIGRQPQLSGRLMSIDMNSLSFDFFQIERVQDCPVCSRPKRALKTKMEKPVVNALCSSTFNVYPPAGVVFDIATAANRARRKYEVVEGPTFIRVDLDNDVQITLMRNGNAIVKGVNTPEEALRLYEEITARK